MKSFGQALHASGSSVDGEFRASKGSGKYVVGRREETIKMGKGGRGGKSFLCLRGKV